MPPYKEGPVRRIHSCSLPFSERAVRTGKVSTKHSPALTAYCVSCTSSPPHQHIAIQPMSNAESLADRIARLEAALAAAQLAHAPEPAADAQQQVIQLPWQGKSSASAIRLVGDSRPGYPLPACAAPYFERARSDFILSAESARAIARCYPLPDVPAIQHKSKVDDFIADRARSAKVTFTTAAYLAQRDRLQADNDLQARIAIPALHTIHEVRRQLDPNRLSAADPHQVLDGDESDVGSIDNDEPRSTAVPCSGSAGEPIIVTPEILDALGSAESMLRDLLICNRALAAALETCAREQLAASLELPATVRGSMARLHSESAEQLFGTVIERELDSHNERADRAAIRTLAAVAIKSSAKHSTNFPRIGGATTATPASTVPARQNFVRRPNFGKQRFKPREFPNNKNQGAAPPSGPPQSVPRSSTY